MAWIQPNSTIHLLQNVPLTNAYIHTTDYSNESAQFADFYSYKVASFTEYTYIRNNAIKIQLNTIFPKEKLAKTMFKNSGGKK